MNRSKLRAIPALALFLLALLWPAVTPSIVPGIPVDAQGRPAYVPGEVLVQMAEGSALSALGASPASMLADPGAARRLGASGPVASMHRVRLVAGVGVGEALLALRNDPTVVSADPNYLNYPLLTPTDPDWGQMWGMANTNQTIPSAIYPTNNPPGAGGADVSAETAWDTATGAGVTVAVIDSGLDYTHPEFVGRLWTGASGAACPNSAGAPTKYGCDFADADDDPYPIASFHGTHVAGTIAATHNNGIGVPGMAFDATIMGLKVFPDDGGGAADSDIISAIAYAAANGASIANLSLGRGGAESGTMTTTVVNAINAGLLLVVAAGNGGADGLGDSNDATSQWPANYAGHSSTAVGVITVAATDQLDAIADFSNFGATTVSLGAPGVNILSSIWDRSIEVLEDGSGGAALGVCSTDPDTCFDNSIFDNGATDCIGTNCTWAGGDISTFYTVVGDFNATTTYANNIDGTIKAGPFNAATWSGLVLRYWAVWDLQCGAGNSDYVDVEVSSNDSTWTRLTAPNYNVADDYATYCTSAHTHTGRMLPIFGNYTEFVHDLSAFDGSATLYVRFRMATNASVNSTTLQYAFRVLDVQIDRAGGNTANAYELSNGTSMASPMVAGIAALVKEAFPAYSPSQIKHVILDSGDAVGSLSGITVTGRRANAANAVSGSITPPAPESATLPPSTGGGGGGGGCLVTWATAGWLPDRALDPLRGVRETLWQSGDWGRAAVRAYYRGSAAAIGWLESAGPALPPAGTTARL